MRNISTALASHLAGEVTTLATCWKITRTDSVVLGFTDHDADIVFDSVTYYAESSFTPAQLTTSDDMKGDTLTLQGVLSSDYITDADLLAGRYDFAEVESFQVNYTDLTQGKLILCTGWLGQVKKGSERYEAELSGLASRLVKTLGQLYSPLCRANLGDAQCTIDMTPLTKTGAVTSVTDQRVFADTSRTETAGYFDYGNLTFTSGLNAGFSMEVKDVINGTIELAMPMPFAIAVSDTYSIQAGCDKTFPTCTQRFNNAINFRGEPFVPGTDKMLATSTTSTVSS